MKKRIILFIALVLLAGNACAEEVAKEPENADAVIAEMHKRLDAILAKPLPKVLSVTNKESARYFDMELRTEPNAPYISDIEFKVHSPKVTKEFNFPPYLEMDLPDGMVMLAYSQVTHGNYTTCLLKFMIEKALGAKKGEVNQFAPYFDQVILGMRARSPEVKPYLPKNLGGIKYTVSMSNDVIYLGPAGEIKGDMYDAHYGRTLLRLYAQDMGKKEKKYDYYATDVHCHPKLTKRMQSQEMAIMIQKDNAKFTSRPQAENYIYMPLPKKFTNLVGKMMQLSQSAF